MELKIVVENIKTGKEVEYEDFEDFEKAYSEGLYTFSEVEVDGIDVTDIVTTLLSEYTSDLREILRIIEEDGCTTWSGYSMQDVAEQIIEEGGYFDGLPSDSLVVRYFNYDAFAQDLKIEGNFFDTGKGFFVEVY